jgi:hypothetical protein
VAPGVGHPQVAAADGQRGRVDPLRVGVVDCDGAGSGVEAKDASRRRVEHKQVRAEHGDVRDRTDWGRQASELR